MDKTGREEILLKYVFLLLMLFSTKIRGQPNTKLVMDLQLLTTCLNGLGIK